MFFDLRKHSNQQKIGDILSQMLIKYNTRATNDVLNALFRIFLIMSVET